MWVLLWKATVKRRKKCIVLVSSLVFPLSAQSDLLTLKAESRSCFKGTFGFVGFGRAVHLQLKPCCWVSTGSAAWWVNLTAKTGQHHHHCRHRLWIPSYLSVHLVSWAQHGGTDSPRSNSQTSWPSPSHHLPCALFTPCPPTCGSHLPCPWLSVSHASFRSWQHDKCIPLHFPLVSVSQIGLRYSQVNDRTLV